MPAASIDAQELARLRHELAAIRVSLAFRRCRLALKAGYRQEEPRIPAGNPGIGGRWTREGDAVRTRLAQNPPRRPGSVSVMVDGEMLEATPAQAARLAATNNMAEQAIARVRELDPNWRPTPGIRSGIDGAIARNEADIREANARNLGLRAGTLSLQDILMPGGRAVGVANPGAGAKIRTVTPAEWDNIRLQLIRNAEPISTPPGYNGIWYQRRDGTTVGIRMS